jgi:hypothetical protein
MHTVIPVIPVINLEWHAHTSKELFIIIIILNFGMQLIPNACAAAVSIEACLSVRSVFSIDEPGVSSRLRIEATSVRV